MKLLASLALIGALAACTSPPPRFDSPQLAERERAAVLDLQAQRATLSAKLLQRTLAKMDNAAAGVANPLNILILSGGGEYGAFGVGVLQGWTQAGPMPQPHFDVVTGVSTGALIAPFALVGTEDSVGRVEHLYRETDRTFAVLRDFLFFLPWRESFFDNGPLRERIHSEVNEDLARSIAAAYAEDRLLLIGTTDLDLGRMRVWDFGREAQLALESGEFDRLGDMLLASAAIPAVFPPVTLDGTLHVDGGATQQAFIGFDLEQFIDVMRQAKRLRPHAALPGLRVWVIVNGPLDDASESMALGWGSVAKRSLRVLMHYSLRVTLRHLQFQSALLAASTGMPVEFRYVSVPDEFRRRVVGSVLFDSEFMAELNELGRRVGADASSWRTSVGSVAQRDAQTAPER